MKPVNVFLLALSVAALLAMGSACVALAIDPSSIARMQAFTSTVEGSLASAGPFRPVLGVGGAALMGLAVGVVWGNLSQRRWERIILLRTPLGEVLVSLSALEDLGRLVKGEVPGLRDIKLRVTASRRGINADARVTLQGDVDLAQVSEAVQAAVRRRLQLVVGPEQDIRPRVRVGKVVTGATESEELLEMRPRTRRPGRP